jgi:mono/diheme cytochrome c family protein
MRSSNLTALVAAAMLLGTSGLALAQAKPKYDLGKREYDANCANCHGAMGKGDGPYKPWLTKSATDLTKLTKTNAGVFPYQTVYDTIDGRLEVKAHGPRDMPIWGADYLAKSAGDYMDVPYIPEVYVRARIMALTEYIFRLQEK